jgi:hypothetical protein
MILILQGFNVGSLAETIQKKIHEKVGSSLRKYKRYISKFYITQEFRRKPSFRENIPAGGSLDFH